MPPPCRTPPGQKPGYPPGPAPIAPLMAMVSMPLWLDDTSTAVRGYSSSWSPPDTSRAPFPHRSPRRSSANAACGGLKPPPDRRLRRAKPSSPTEHRFLKVLPIYIQTPIPRSWRTSGGPCTTPLRYSPHRSFQGADTHQRDSALRKGDRNNPSAVRHYASIAAITCGSGATEILGIAHGLCERDQSAATVAARRGCYRPRYRTGCSGRPSYPT